MFVLTIQHPHPLNIDTLNYRAFSDRCQTIYDAYSKIIDKSCITPETFAKCKIRMLMRTYKSVIWIKGFGTSPYVTFTLECIVKKCFINSKCFNTQTCMWYIYLRYCV